MTSPARISNDDPLIGCTLAGRYHIQARIGAGAMGAVYRAEQAGLDRPVALKVLKRDMAWGGDTVQRFRREAKAMSALNHPHTVRVFDFGATNEGVLYLAMEMLEGEPVTEFLMRVGVIEVRAAVIYAQEILRSIGEAHAKGIVHRDLKPDNIFLARVEGETEPVVKVLDFGIAKAVEGERKIDQFETLDGTVFGTPRYMAPEQAAGKTLDSRSDLYAVGIILYEFLTGQPPFVDSDAVVVMAKHIREKPVPIGKAAPARLIPKSLEAAVSKALEKDPSQRWQSADEFDQALEACLSDVDFVARTSVHGVLLGRVATAPAKVRALMAAGLLAGLLLLAAGARWAFSGPDTEQASATVHVQVPEAPRDNPEQGLPPAAAAPGATPPSAAAAAVAKPAVVTLQSEPAGAEVWRDGTQLGVTPLEIVVPTGSTASVSLRKRGYVEPTVELGAADPKRTIGLAALSTTAVEPTRATRRGRPRRVGKTASPASQSTSGARGGDSPYEKF